MPSTLEELDVEQGLFVPSSHLLWGSEERNVVSISNYIAGKVLASVLLVCLATCIRAYVVHQLEQTMNSSQGVSSLAEALQIVSSAQPFIVGGQAIDLNNLRLSLIQRDFGASDYERLLALDAGTSLAASQRVSESCLASLPTFRHSRLINSASKKGEEHLCCVCLEAFSEGATVTQLGCKHCFHGDCIQPWLRQQGLSSTCPLCKARVWPHK